MSQLEIINTELQHHENLKNYYKLVRKTEELPSYSKVQSIQRPLTLTIEEQLSRPYTTRYNWTASTNTLFAITMDKKEMGKWLPLLAGTTKIDTLWKGYTYKLKHELIISPAPFYIGKLLVWLDITPNLFLEMGIKPNDDRLSSIALGLQRGYVPIFPSDDLTREFIIENVSPFNTYSNNTLWEDWTAGVLRCYVMNKLQTQSTKKTLQVAMRTSILDFKSVAP